MAAPTTEFDDGAGTITATGEANGLLKKINPSISRARMRLGFSGTFTSAVVAVRGRLRGIQDIAAAGGQFYPIMGKNLTIGMPVATSASISLTNGTNAAFEFDVQAFDQIEVYCVSGTPTDLDVEERVEPAAPDELPIFVTSLTSAFTYSGDTLYLDNVLLKLGTGSDITFTWDATDLIVGQAAADSFVKWGVAGAGINHLFYGDTSGRDMTWDQSNDQLLFADNAKLAIGTGAGAAGDITFSWNATKMLVAQLTANSAIDWGVDGAGIDQVWYGDTASTSMTWDQSADSLIFTGAARVVWTGTTGQPEMHLTDNLADALSVEISGSTDLMVFTTTDDAESVAIRGVRHTQTTAVAITGATTLKLADSGGIFTVSQAAAYDIDLPSPTSGPGCRYFFSLTAPGANAVTITVAGGAATFVGSITIDGATVVATGSTLTFASGASLLGDSIEIQSIATNLYHVRAIASGAGGITIA